MLKSKNTVEVANLSVGSVAKRVKASFLRWPWSRDHGFKPHPGHVFESLDKTLYDDYLCLVALNKQQIYDGRSHRSTGKLGKWSTPTRVRIRPKDSATVAFSWKENKDASINQAYYIHRVRQESRNKAVAIAHIYSPVTGQRHTLTYWTIRTLFITTTTSWLEEYAPA